MTVENEKSTELNLEERSVWSNFDFKLYFYKDALRHFYTIRFHEMLDVKIVIFVQSYDIYWIITILAFIILTFRKQ